MQNSCILNQSIIKKRPSLSTSHGHKGLNFSFTWLPQPGMKTPDPFPGKY